LGSRRKGPKKNKGGERGARCTMSSPQKQQLRDKTEMLITDGLGTDKCPERKNKKSGRTT